MAKGFDKLKKALGVVQQNKTSAEKKEERKAHTQRLAEMELYVDMSLEKRELFMDCTLNEVCSDTGLRIIEKGIITFAKRLEVIEILKEDLNKKKIDLQVITGTTTTKKRGKIEEWFCESPKNKMVVISKAGGQSLNLHATNELILYNIPDGYTPFKQTIGRTARGFGKYDSYNIHIIQVDDTLDEYKQVLISSRKQLENELLNCDSIPLKDVSTFNQEILKKTRKRILWKEFKKK